MRKVYWSVLYILALTTLYNCSSYVESFHQSFKRNDVRQKYEKNYDQFERYRNIDRERYHKGFLNKTVRNDRKKSEKKSKNKLYNRFAHVKKRYTAEDLKDNGYDGSLWSNINGSDNYLFTNNDIKQVGDIVLLNVLDKFRIKIAMELKRMFPAPIVEPLVKSDKKETKGEEGKPEKVAEKPKEKKVKGAEVEIHDKISCIISEEINRDHIILKGKKDVIFRNKKHLVEIQAILQKKHINADNIVDSNKLLESSVDILY